MAYKDGTRMNVTSESLEAENQTNISMFTRQVACLLSYRYSMGF